MLLVLIGEVNSLCQQGSEFALSVNRRHQITNYYKHFNTEGQDG